MRLTEADSEKKRLAILIAIEAYRNVNGVPPSFRDVSTSVGMSYTGSKYHLERLREKGLVTWTPRVSRTLRLTDRAKEFLDAAERW